MKKITISHGNGGELSGELINNTILKNINGKSTGDMMDSAGIFNNLGFTTDSFVIFPHFFNGGDIGKLSICGTVNDLIMSGYEPKYISLSLILEEGYSIESLEEITRSVSRTCDFSGVEVVTGDTKVVEKGSGSGVYINTSGIGEKIQGFDLSYDRIIESDQVIVTGEVGDHGVSILCEREKILEGQLVSDCHPLVELIPTLKKFAKDIKIMRDPTRGGIATTLNEFVEKTQRSITIYEEKIPINEKVEGACELFGLDPLYSANEGKGVIIISKDKSDEFIEELRKIEIFKRASIIGEVGTRDKGIVLYKTRFGGRRILSKLTHDILPRIC